MLAGMRPHGGPSYMIMISNFSNTYQTLGVDTQIEDFHLQDGLLCHFGQLCVPSRKHENMIWEAHYSWEVGHFGMEKTMVVLLKYFYYPNI
jgi:hypothetical protein